MREQKHESKWILSCQRSLRPNSEGTKYLCFHFTVAFDIVP